MTVPHHKEDDSLIGEWWKGFLKAAKQPPSRTTWLVLVVIVLIVVLVGSWFWFTTSAGAASSDLWLKKLQTPLTTADLERFGNDPSHKGSVQARFALAEAARLYMRSIDRLESINSEEVNQARTDVGKAATSTRTWCGIPATCPR